LLSEEEPMGAVWGYEGEHSDLNLVEVLVVRLRKKIRFSSTCLDPIQTVQGPATASG
jgi:DNA-binding response OmpR family regulator